MDRQTHENYPLRLVLLCLAAGFMTYGIGAYLMSRLGAVYLASYLLLCLWIETRVLWESCRDCHYYGKWCAFGKGKLCSLLFTPGAPERFAAKVISWRDVFPDFLASIIPFLGGAVLLLRNFTWPVFGFVLALIALSTAGTGFVRGSVACKYCRRRELGCPAERLFNKSGVEAP